MSLKYSEKTQLPSSEREPEKKKDKVVQLNKLLSEAEVKAGMAERKVAPIKFDQVVSMVNDFSDVENPPIDLSRTVRQMAITAESAWREIVFDNFKITTCCVGSDIHRVATIVKQVECLFGYNFTSENPPMIMVLPYGTQIQLGLTNAIYDARFNRILLPADEINNNGPHEVVHAIRDSYLKAQSLPRNTTTQLFDEGEAYFVNDLIAYRDFDYQQKYTALIVTDPKFPSMPDWKSPKAWPWRSERTFGALMVEFMVEQQGLVALKNLLDAEIKSFQSVSEADEAYLDSIIRGSGCDYEELRNRWINTPKTITRPNYI